MKYMGSKKAMLLNGLGKVLDRELSTKRRFIDLFCGSASVAWHVAMRSKVSTHAYDLQLYSAALADAIVSRTSPLDPQTLWSKWIADARRLAANHKTPVWSGRFSKTVVGELRSWCSDHAPETLIHAYGGHYFGPEQIVWIDALRKCLPPNAAHRKTCLAALLMAASKTVASPGHTAQPFQPTATAKEFLFKSWTRDIRMAVLACLKEIAPMHALTSGSARVADANDAIATVRATDLVFVDPPYSAVHYSRFYHVLESIAQGSAGPVSGIGRYPPENRRPKSLYSLKARSHEAMQDLLEHLATTGATIVLTFPDHVCSNGLSGDAIREMARRNFSVHERSVKSTFSTLGGVGANVVLDGARKARQSADELILCLRPRSRRSSRLL